MKPLKLAVLDQSVSLAGSSEDAAIRDTLSLAEHCERLEFTAEAGPGDFIYVPPYVPHQEINADPSEPLQCVLVRSDNEAVVVNIPDVAPVEPPEAVYWIDPIHKAGG